MLVLHHIEGLSSPEKPGEDLHNFAKIQLSTRAERLHDQMKRRRAVDVHSNKKNRRGIHFQREQKRDSLLTKKKGDGTKIEIEIYKSTIQHLHPPISTTCACGDHF